MALPAPTKTIAKKRAFAMKKAERRFVLQVAAIRPTEESKRRAEQLRKKTQQAKSADFLQHYRIAA